MSNANASAAGSPEGSGANPQVEKVEKIKMEWTIDKFSALRGKEQSQVLNSVKFSTGANDGIKWCLQLRPNGHNEETRDFVGVYLKLESSLNNARVTANFKISLMKGGFLEVAKVKGKELEHSFIPGEWWGYPRFAGWASLLRGYNQIYPQSSVRIVAEVSVRQEGTTRLANIPDDSFEQNLARILETGEYADVTLVAGNAGEEIKAHRSVLAARSSVFRVMFSHDMAEQKSNRVVIPDIEPNVVRVLLRFMYTGEINFRKNNENDSEDDEDSDDDSEEDSDDESDEEESIPTIIGLLSAADKYDVVRLKLLCEESLTSRMSPENAADILAVSHLHSRKELMTRAIQFIKSHADEVKESKGWQNLTKNNPLADVYQALVPVPDPPSTYYEGAIKRFRLTDIRRIARWPRRPLRQRQPLRYPRVR